MFFPPMSIYYFFCFEKLQLTLLMFGLYRMGRDMAYDSWSCDLLCAASSPDLYRINLEQVFSILFVVMNF